MTQPRRFRPPPVRSPLPFAALLGLLGALTVLLATLLPLPPPASAAPLPSVTVSGTTPPLASARVTSLPRGYSGREPGLAGPAPARPPLTQVTPATGEDPACRGGRPRAGSAWPAGAYRTVTRGFAPPAQRWQAGHRGVDLAAPAGTPVVAPAAGQVRFAGTVAGKPVVSLSHAGGLVTTYEPVAATVAVGTHVRAGDVIGTLTAGHEQPAAGNATTHGPPPGTADARETRDAHASTSALHWGARTGRHTYVNPLRLVCAPVIRLKPVLPGA